MNMIKEPYYVIDFNASACMFDIQINKISLFLMDVKGQIGSEAPVNYLIPESGKQELDIIVYPNIGKTGFDQNTKFSASIKLFDLSSGSFVLVEDGIASFKMSDEDKKVPVCKHKNYFMADVPYKLVAWQESVDLSTVEDLREKVESAYQKLGNIITKGQYNTFRNFLQESEKNAAISMYLDEEESKERTDELISDFQNGYVVEPLSGTEVMHLYADNKLVCLKTAEGSSALSLRHKETDETLTIDILFHLKQGETDLSAI